MEEYKSNNADHVVGRLNKIMTDKGSDVRFHWGATSGNETKHSSYFLLFGTLDSEWTYNHSGPILSCFIFKGMATMLHDIIDREGEVDRFENYVLKSLSPAATL